MSSASSSIRFLCALLSISTLLVMIGCRSEHSVLFVGDIAFGESYRSGLPTDASRKRRYDTSVSALAPLLGSADLVVGNLETPITNMPRSPFAGKKRYIHHADVVETPAALSRHGIDIVSLANNHAFDYGAEGLSQSIRLLDAHEIAHYGAGASAKEAGASLVVTMPVGDVRFRLALIGAFEQQGKTYRDDYHFYADRNDPGVNALDAEALARQIADLKERMPGIFVIVTPHWGQNYGRRTAAQRHIAHALIDAGADLIVGHGAHLAQTIERYRDRLILYNLGNFVFLSPGRYAQKKVDAISLAAELVLDERQTPIAHAVRLYPIITDNLRTGYQPRPANRKERDQALKRIVESIPTTIPRTGHSTMGPYIEITLTN